MERRIIQETANKVLLLIDKEDEVLLKLIVYPLKGYGNNYEKTIAIGNDYIEIYQVCDTYAIPPCTSMSDYVVLAKLYDADFATKLKDVLKQVKNIFQFILC